jgi:hypothetical protein
MKVVMCFAIAALFLTMACGEKVDELSETIGNIKSMAESAEDAKEEMDAAEKRRMERVKAGDTLAMAPEELMKYLPASISGYEAQEPEYNSTEMPGLSFTQVNRRYTSKSGSEIRISITDYNASSIGYLGAAGMFKLKWKTDNKDEFQQTFETGNPLVGGHERYDKRNKEATVTYGVGGRFLLSISAEDQSSTEQVRKIASSMNLDKMSKL